MMTGFKTAIELLPSELRQALEEIYPQQAEEIRLRLDRRPSLLIKGSERSFGSREVCERDMLRIIEKATGASLHTVAPELAEGYINYKGLRIGVCGRVCIQNGEISGFRNYSSIAIRIPKECRGICDRIISESYSGGFESTLIISPPGYGKTTAMREMIRVLSNMAYRLSVIDERNELSASNSFDLGKCSDIFFGVPKAKGAMMALRAMNPQIIAMDEISKVEDIAAISDMSGCGVEVLATAHASSISSLKQRPLYREMLKLGVFKNCLMINCTNGERSYVMERIVP